MPEEIEYVDRLPQRAIRQHFDLLEQMWLRQEGCQAEKDRQRHQDLVWKSLHKDHQDTTTITHSNSSRGEKPFEIEIKNNFIEG